METNLLNIVQEIINSHKIIDSIKIKNPTEVDCELRVTQITKEINLITGEEVINVYMRRMWDRCIIQINKKEIIEIDYTLFNDDVKGYKAHHKQNELNKSLMKLFKPYFKK